ncbi:MAG: TonB C-terminal domain-containing protein [bacterium]|nr:TonB C-terminal domain-containing protein [bacterium]
MKFRIAVILSIVLHVSLVIFAMVTPHTSPKSGTVYRARLIGLPGGGQGSKKSSGPKNTLVKKAGSVRDLTTKKAPPKAKLRYPTNVKKKQSRKKKQRAKLVSAARKNKNKEKKNESPVTVTRRKGSGGLRTGISSGSGSGTGSGSGNGSGVGSGSGGLGDFPYAYYVEIMRNKISESWYGALVSPGLKGQFMTVVYFRIKRNGSVGDLKLETSSGSKTLDLSSLRAIRDAAPFPPLPTDFTGTYLGVHFEFEWER